MRSIHLVIGGWLLYGVIRGLAWMLKSGGEQIPVSILLPLLFVVTMLGAAGAVWGAKALFGRRGRQPKTANGLALAGGLLLVGFALPGALAIWALSRF